MKNSDIYNLFTHKSNNKKSQKNLNFTPTLIFIGDCERSNLVAQISHIGTDQRVNNLTVLHEMERGNTSHLVGEFLHITFLRLVDVNDQEITWRIKLLLCKLSKLWRDAYTWSTPACRELDNAQTA